MSIHISRRKFLSSSARSTVGIAALSAFHGNVGTVLVKSAPPNLGLQESFLPVFARLDEFIARHLTETGAPGMTLALANREGPLRVSTYGFADTKTAQRVVPETMFEIGSISKSFVALTLLQIREEGKLDLNKPIIEYLPWLKINSKFAPVTTHHILSHTAGLPGAPLLLDAMLAELWTGYAPGNRFLYSNTGYNILGFLIEALDKRPFAESLRARVLAPLGMTNTSPLITQETRRRMAVGYEPMLDDRPFATFGKLAEAPWLEMDMAAGSIASTPEDMSRYLRMLLNRGALPKGRLISEESFALFTKPEVKAPFRGEDASYAYGFWISDVAGHTRLRHTGGMVAFSSSIDADLTAGVGAFASVNANLRGYRPVAVTRYAVELLNAAIGGKPLADPPPPPAPPTEIKNASDYAGTFSSPAGKKLLLVAAGERLILNYRNQQIPLERAGRDLFLVKHPDFELFLLGFTRDKEQVTEAFYGPDWYAGEKYSGPRVFEAPKEWSSFVGHYHCDSAWYGDTRIVLRNGKLYSNGVEPLVPRGDGKFGFGETDGPDWVAFESIVDGRAMRLNLSGIIYRRIFTP